MANISFLNPLLFPWHVAHSPRISLWSATTGPHGHPVMRTKYAGVAYPMSHQASRLSAVQHSIPDMDMSLASHFWMNTGFSCKVTALTRAIASDADAPLLQEHRGFRLRNLTYRMSNMFWTLELSVGWVSEVSSGLGCSHRS